MKRSGSRPRCSPGTSTPCRTSETPTLGRLRPGLQGRDLWGSWDMPSSRSPAVSVPSSQALRPPECPSSPHHLFSSVSPSPPSLPPPHTGGTRPLRWGPLKVHLTTGGSRQWPATPARITLCRAEAGAPPPPTAGGGAAGWAEAHLRVCQDDHPRVLGTALLLRVLEVYTVPLGLGDRDKQRPPPQSASTQHPPQGAGED